MPCLLLVGLDNEQVNANKIYFFQFLARLRN